jgi:hypothetical protein
LIDPIVQKFRSLRTWYAHRAMAYLVNQGFRQAVLRAHDPRAIDFVGGFYGVQRRLQISSNKAQAILHDVWDAMHMARLPIGGTDHAGLLTYSVEPEAPGRPMLLRTILGDALMPQFVFALSQGRSRSAREARRLVPMRASVLPPVSQNSHHYAAEATLDLLLRRVFAIRSNELASEGSLHLSDADLMMLAEEAELSKRARQPVFKAWIKDDGEQEAESGEQGALFPVLLRTAPESYQLADPRLHRFLLDQGGHRVASSERAKRRTRSRRNAPHRSS